MCWNFVFFLSLSLSLSCFTAARNANKIQIVYTCFHWKMNNPKCLLWMQCAIFLKGPKMHPVRPLSVHSNENSHRRLHHISPLYFKHSCGFVGWLAALCIYMHVLPSYTFSYLISATQIPISITIFEIPIWYENLFGIHAASITYWTNIWHFRINKMNCRRIYKRSF